MISFIYKSKSKYRLGGAVVAGEKFKNSLIENGITLESLSYSIGNSNFLGILKDSFHQVETLIEKFKYQIDELLTENDWIAVRISKN